MCDMEVGAFSHPNENTGSNRAYTYASNRDRQEADRRRRESAPSRSRFDAAAIDRISMSRTLEKGRDESRPGTLKRAPHRRHNG